MSVQALMRHLSVQALMRHFDERMMNKNDIEIRIQRESMNKSNNTVLIEGDVGQRLFSSASSDGQMVYGRNFTNETNKSVHIVKGSRRLGGRTLERYRWAQKWPTLTSVYASFRNQQKGDLHWIVIGNYPFVEGH